MRARNGLRGMVPGGAQPHANRCLMPSVGARRLPRALFQQASEHANGHDNPRIVSSP